MTGKHTATPWSINTGSVVTRLIGYPDKCIAELRLMGPNKAANARLIVQGANNLARLEDEVQSLRAENESLRSDNDAMRDQLAVANDQLRWARAALDSGYRTSRALAEIAKIDEYFSALSRIQERGDAEDMDNG